MVRRRILITGSSGQIGTNLALRLIERGHECMGVDIRPNSWTDRVPTTLFDLRSPLAGFDWPADVVVHLAAHAKVHATVTRPTLAFENVRMGEHVLEFARRRRAAVLLGSSREVYGNNDSTAVPEKAVFVDASASPYSASKVALEAMGHAYRRTYRLPVATLRFSNVYGRFDCDIDRLERVVPLFMRLIARSEPITIFGPEKMLDFTYVDDCVEGISLACDALASGALDGITLNVASGRGSSLLAVAGRIGELVGRKPIVQIRPIRIGEIAHYVADLSRSRALLGYVPKVGIEEGLERALGWQAESGWLTPDAA